MASSLSFSSLSPPITKDKLKLSFSSLSPPITKDKLKLSMSSSPSLKRLLASNLLHRSAVARPAASRLFNTNAVRESDVDRPPEPRLFSTFIDIFGPCLERSSLNIILKLDQYVKSPERSTKMVFRNWDARETADWIQLRMDMPGLGKEDVKVSVEQNTVTIEGKKKEFEEDEEDGVGGRRYMYSRVIDLPEGKYNTSEIKAEMKKGVLKVFLPKIKQMSGVFYVNIG
ncbi:23.6 kDa heat shock protein- mitochondrial [Striga hermonthica]|uniref:23.6 kDa heat shock protein- mitochondrial n=1 Tax=Striga hermonthica TaxID=68872 RepID=A0A9N7R8F8_STRHE|nr:23.6 kDa heat shock protein- mitochondrial [Striga hermonthica]